MQPPRVSVIIPVYNTAAYVEQAVQSILHQTLRELEILIVDDGSTDGSPALLARLTASDDRIRLRTQPNAGQAAARNAALAEARGEYVYFMDSDDLLEADALELCYEKCRHDNLDFVFFDADTFGAPTASAPWFDYHRAARFEDRVYSGSELLDAMLRTHTYRASICLHLIRRTLLAREGIRFRPGIVHEDELFTTRLYLAAQRTGRIDRSFFKRRLREGSTMTLRFSERNLAGYLAVLDEMCLLARQSDHRARQLIRRYIRYTLNPVLRNAWALPTRVRIRTAATAATRYFRSAEPKALAVLLLKRPLKKLLRR